MLAAKVEYKAKTGQDWVAEGGAASRPAKTAVSTPAASASSAAPAAATETKEAKPKAEKVANVAHEPKAAKGSEAGGEGGAAKQTLLGITTKKEVDLADWYSQVGFPVPTPISLGHCNPHSSSLLVPTCFHVCSHLTSSLSCSLSRIPGTATHFLCCSRSPHPLCCNRAA